MAGRVFVVTSCNFTAPIATSGALSNPLEVLKRNQPALPVLGGIYATGKFGSKWTAPWARYLGIWYRDRPHDGRRIYRRITVGTVRQFRTAASARKGIAGLIRAINFGVVRVRATALTVGELVEHYRQRESASDKTWKSYSTKRGYKSYLKNWIVPHWGNYKLPDAKT